MSHLDKFRYWYVKFNYKRFKMKVLKELDEAKLVIVDLEVNLGKEVRSAPTLCAKYKGKIIPLNTAHDGRPILMLSLIHI